MNDGVPATKFDAAAVAIRCVASRRRDPLGGTGSFEPPTQCDFAAAPSQMREGESSFWLCQTPSPAQHCSDVSSKRYVSHALPATHQALHAFAVVADGTAASP